MTTPGVQIRLLNDRDSLEELTELFHRAYAHLLERGLRYVAATQDVATTRERIEGGECYLAIDAERVVGTVTFRDGAHTGGAPWYERDDVASFQQLCVEPAERGRGIAAALLDHIEARALDTGAHELACDTAKPATDLIGMYERRGYRVVADVSWQPVTNYQSVILSKTLRSR